MLNADEKIRELNGIIKEQDVKSNFKIFFENEFF